MASKRKAPAVEETSWLNRFVMETPMMRMDCVDDGIVAVVRKETARVLLGFQ